MNAILDALGTQGKLSELATSKLKKLDPQGVALDLASKQLELVNKSNLRARILLLQLRATYG